MSLPYGSQTQRFPSRWRGIWVLWFTWRWKRVRLSGKDLIGCRRMSLPNGSHESHHPCFRAVPLLERSGRGNLVPLRRDEGRGARLHMVRRRGSTPPPGRTIIGLVPPPARSRSLRQGHRSRTMTGNRCTGPDVRMSHRVFERFAHGGERSGDFPSSVCFF